MDKSQITTKKDMMAMMQRFEQSLNDTVELLTSRASLDSTVIYPKPGLPNNMRPIKEKTYQEQTFALRIPLELDNDDLDLLKMEHLSRLRLLGEVLRIAPPYSTMGETLF